MRHFNTAVLVLSAVVVSVIPVVAKADVTYQYIGQNFTSRDTTARVEGTVTYAAPLAPDTCTTVAPLSYAFSVNNHTASDQNDVAAPEFQFCLIGTDIVDWRVVVEGSSNGLFPEGVGDTLIQILTRDEGDTAVLRECTVIDSGSCRVGSAVIGSGPSGQWSVVEPPTPSEQLEDLATLVVDINLQAGISNSLDSKLDATLTALDDTNENNDAAAINSLYAFCSNVEAQRGKKLTVEQADQLIEGANGIISSLDENASLCQ